MVELVIFHFSALQGNDSGLGLSVRTLRRAYCTPIEDDAFIKASIDILQDTI